MTVSEFTTSAWRFRQDASPRAFPSPRVARRSEDVVEIVKLAIFVVFGSPLTDSKPARDAAAGRQPVKR